MKKISIVMLMMAFVFAAANLYACGNQSKADVNSSKAEYHNSSGSNQMSSCSATCQAGAKASATRSNGKVRVITTEYKTDHISKATGTAVNGMADNCPAAKDADASASKSMANAKVTKDNKAVNPILIAPIDLSSYDQK